VTWEEGVGDSELAPGEAGGGGVRPTLTRRNGGGGARLQTAGGNAVGFGHGGETVGFGPSLSGRRERRGEATSDSGV
jgi:hypothetical protein